MRTVVESCVKSPIV